MSSQFIYLFRHLKTHSTTTNMGFVPNTHCHHQRHYIFSYIYMKKLLLLLRKKGTKGSKNSFTLHKTLCACLLPFLYFSPSRTSEKCSSCNNMCAYHMHNIMASSTLRTRIKSRLSELYRHQKGRCNGITIYPTWKYLKVVDIVTFFETRRTINNSYWVNELCRIGFWVKVSLLPFHITPVCQLYIGMIFPALEVARGNWTRCHLRCRPDFYQQLLFIYQIILLFSLL